MEIFNDLDQLSGHVLHIKLCFDPFSRPGGDFLKQAFIFPKSIHLPPQGFRVLRFEKKDLFCPLETAHAWADCRLS